MDIIKYQLFRTNKSESLVIYMSSCFGLMIILLNEINIT